MDRRLHDLAAQLDAGLIARRQFLRQAAIITGSTAAGLHVLCVKPGFVKTGMTAGLKPPPFAGEPDRVARDVIHAMDRRKPLIYTPGIWALVMLVIRLLPRFVMRRIGF